MVPGRFAFLSLPRRRGCRCGVASFTSRVVDPRASFPSLTIPVALALARAMSTWVCPFPIEFSVVGASRLRASAVGTIRGGWSPVPAVEPGLRHSIRSPRVSSRIRAVQVLSVHARASSAVRISRPHPDWDFVPVGRRWLQSVPCRSRRCALVAPLVACGSELVGVSRGFALSGGSALMRHVVRCARPP